MGSLWEHAPWFLAMAGLLCASALFSAGEAAIFSLNRQARRRLAASGRSQRAAVALLADADRFLTAVLFANLCVNIAYFTLDTIVSLALDRQGRHAEAGLVAVASLLVLIAFGEVLPKSLAVLMPERIAGLVGTPLSLVVRLADPLLPTFRGAAEASRRAIWPSFQPEADLAVGDLERAVRLSTSNAAILEHEQTVLQGIVSLSDIEVEELMRPRTRFVAFHPPVALADLGGQITSSGYLLITEPDGDEVAAALNLTEAPHLPQENLERLARPVVYVPWSATVAQALELLLRSDQRVAAVVNEYGETIGVLTFDDILDTIFSATASRSERLLRRAPIRPAGPNRWLVTGMTSLRRLERHFNLVLPESKGTTVSGVVQEVLERMPEPGDEGRWGPFRFKVLAVPERGRPTVELTRIEPEDRP